MRIEKFTNNNLSQALEYPKFFRHYYYPDKAFEKFDNELQIY